MKGTILCGAILTALARAACAQPVFHVCEHAPMQKSVPDDVDVLALRAEWNIDVRAGRIAGRCTYVFRPLRPVGSLAFDFSDSLTLESVRRNGVPLSYTRRNNVLVCRFPQAVWQCDSVSIVYRGRPKPKDFGTFVVGTDSTAGPWMWTLSQPYGAAEWFPVRQNLYDKIEEFVAVVTVDEPFYPVSNGVAVREERKNGKVCVEWRHRSPIAAYLIGVAAADYVRIDGAYRDSLTGRSVVVDNYFFPQDLPYGLESVARLEKTFKLFTALFGPYPFERERYAHVRFVRNGGM
ncbi:MAG: hypothetical protein NZ534_06780, partial [Bacteroidia bacterium]|nr:hypothetical protein [Bacteroidia bacterium]